MVPDLAAPHKKINNCPGTRQYQENPRAKGWHWSTPCLTGGKGSGYTWSAAAPTPRPVQQHAERFPLNLWFFQERKKMRNRVATSCPYIVGHLTGGFMPWGLQRICEVQPLGMWLRGEVGRGSQQTARDSWQSSSCLQCPSGSSNQWLYSPAEPNQWCALSRKLVGVQIFLIWALEWGVLSALETRVSMHRQEAKSLPHPRRRVTSSRIWPEGLARALAAVYLRNAWAETGR